MRFSISAVLALATAVVAHVDFDSINKPASNEVIPAGSSYTVQWTTLAPQFKDSVVTVSLVGGETQNTQVVLDQVASKSLLQVAVRDCLKSVRPGKLTFLPSSWCQELCPVLHLDCHWQVPWPQGLRLEVHHRRH